MMREVSVSRVYVLGFGPILAADVAREVTVSMYYTMWFNAWAVGPKPYEHWKIILVARPAPCVQRTVV